MRRIMIIAATTLALSLVGCRSAANPADSTARSGSGAAPTVSVTGAAGAAGAPSGAAATARPGGPAPTGVPVGMGSPAADGVFPRTVTHFGGTTRIAEEPKRIVTIATGQLDSVLTLGVVPMATAAGAGAAPVPDYLITAFRQSAPQMRTIASVGSRLEPEFERILVVQPDLILANKAAAAQVYDKLSTIAPTILTQGTGVNWKQDFLLIAAAMGKSDTAQRFLGDYYRQAAEIAERVTGAPPTVSMVRFNPGRTRIFGVASFAGSIAYDAGLARPASQQFNDTSQDLGPEQTDRMDADWIFYSIQGAVDKTDAAKIVGGPFWNRLAAVRAGRAVAVDDDPWYLNAGPTAAMFVLRTLRDSISR